MTEPRRTIDELIGAAREALENLEAYVSDSSDAQRLVAVKDAMPELTAIFKMIAGSCDVNLRHAIADGPIFLADGRTVKVAEELKRTLRAGARAQIRRRIIQRATAESEGEITPGAIETALQILEDTYLSPSALPKWGGLTYLGFSSWSEVADENPVEKGVVVE